MEHIVPPTARSRYEYVEGVVVVLHCIALHCVGIHSHIVHLTNSSKLAVRVQPAVFIYSFTTHCMKNVHVHP